MTGVVVLGSTGSIGRQTLDVVRRRRDRFRVLGLGAAGHKCDLLYEQAVEFDVPLVGVASASAGEWLRNCLPGRTVIDGRGALSELALAEGADVVVAAVVGTAGLEPVLAAARAGRRLALANKESLVAAGELLLATSATHGSKVIPVDSEHSAVFQCLEGQAGPPRRIMLTASGGPFRDLDRQALAAVTPDQALAHPTWRMGPKISVDSATLANKGLEVIEAHALFGVGYDAIEVYIHRQSIVHSLVELADGSVLAQLGWPDMRLPIAYALSYPARLPLGVVPFDPVRAGALTFEPPRRELFPALELGYAAGRAGGTMPAVYNAANEVAVELFLGGRLPLVAIPAVVERVMGAHLAAPARRLEDVLAADAWARERARAAGRSMQR